METTCSKYYLLRFILYLLLFIAKYAEALSNRNHSVSAVLVFGDSTVDAGNNNYIKTIFKGNFLPYGKDFPNQQPTGRFTNGRVTPDFIASYLGIKEFVPPYLDPTLSFEELMTGVSFASAGTGFDPITPQLSNVIPIPKEVEYFKEYKKRLEAVMGKQRTEDHISKALFIISAGTNDFVINYFTLPIRQKTYTVSGYQKFILQKAIQLIQDLHDLGGRRFTFTALPPMGCLPVVITIFSGNENGLLGRKCLDYYSNVGKDFNLMLQQELNRLQSKLGVRISLTDSYSLLSNLITGPGRSAFDEVNQGCCGTGYLEAGILCNPKSPLCPDADKYVFWDAIHPTEQTYKYIFNNIRPGIDYVVGS